MTGTRAYAVREDLKTYNTRLLDYVKAGGNMIVLYNTFELVPNQFAPFPGELLRQRGGSVGRGLADHDPRARRAVVQLAEQDHARRLQRLGRTARIEVLHDLGQGLHADDLDVRQRSAAAIGRLAHGEVRKGHWTYFAYALHRQLPYGVPGAYRITANLLALGKTPK